MCSGRGGATPSLLLVHGDVGVICMYCGTRLPVHQGEVEPQAVWHWKAWGKRRVDSELGWVRFGLLGVSVFRTAAIRQGSFPVSLRDSVAELLGLCWTQELTTHPGDGPIRPYHLRIMRQLLASSDVRATPHTHAHTKKQKREMLLLPNLGTLGLRWCLNVVPLLMCPGLLVPYGHAQLERYTDSTCPL